MFQSVWHDSRLMSLLASFLSLFAVLLFFTASVRWVSQLPFFAIQKVELAGELDRINPAAFKSSVVPKLQGSFFSVDLEQTKNLVEDQSWVRRAVVQRIWPNKLKVIVQSHKPLAYWGDARLINTFGEVFNANPAEAGDPDSMAHLEGPAGSEFLVAKTYVGWIQEFKEVDLDVAHIKLSDRYGWSVQTRQGLEVQLGRDLEPNTLALKIDRFKRVYPKLSTEVMKTIDVIDLRYPKALTVKGERLPPPKLTAPSKTQHL